MKNNLPALFSPSEFKSVMAKTGMTAENMNQLITAYGAPFEDIGASLATYKDIKVTDVKQIDVMKQARQERLKFKAFRVAIKKRHDELKAGILSRGQAIDYINRTVSRELKKAEEYLQEQEDYLETVRKQLRQELIEKRVNAAMAVTTEDVRMYAETFGDMSEGEFVDFLEKLKAKEEERKAEEEARRKQAEEDAKIAERLRQEQEARRLAELEAANARAESLRVQQELAEKRRQEEEAKAEEERQKRIEAQKKADEERRQALLPDRNKILESIAKIDWDRPEMTTEEGKQFAGELFDALHKFKHAWSEKADQVL
mgnify:CR=1 FL=1